MASPDARGSPQDPHVPIDEDRNSQSSSPGAGSYTHSFDESSRTICRWRTTRFHDEECSRYFDCPSHIVERALSDSGQEQEEEEEHEREQDREPVASAEDIANAHSGNVSPLSDDGEEHGDELSARSPSPEAPISTPPPEDSLQRPRGESEERAAEEEDSSLSTAAQGLVVDDHPSPARPEADSGRAEPDQSGSAEPPSPPPAPPPSGSRPNVEFQPANIPAFSPISPAAPVTRPSPAPPAVTQGARRPEVALPRWQPDSEVTYCPFCGTQFSFFVRKHHCRKCGKVVCNSCSPHRITIPYQYIVQPPGASRPLASGTAPSLLDSQGWYPGFGGGERVRLCNPCVPDPQTAPPLSQGASPRPENQSASSVQVDNNTQPSRWGFYLGAGAPNDAQGRNRSVTLGQQPGAQPPARPPFVPPRSAENRILWGTPPPYYRPSPSTAQTPPHHLPHPHHHQHFPGVTAPRYRSMLDVGDRPRPGLPTSSTVAGPSSSSSSSSIAAAAGYPSAAHRRFSNTAFVHRPAPPRPQIPEEDECPVCHRELPPRSLSNFEALREAHISNCITNHSRYGGGGGGGSGSSSAGGTTTAAGATGSPSRAGTGSGGGGATMITSGADMLPPMPPRRTGMFPYAATEKDCVDDAECSICLEEFEVGVAMARLECLCRFHRACINAWWERHPGRCPMHQHDGFGY